MLSRTFGRVGGRFHIVVLSTKCVKDPPPYVTKVSAPEIAKITSLDTTFQYVFSEHFANLLNYRLFEILRTAAAMLGEVVSRKLDSIHPHYLYLSRSLLYMDSSI